MTRQDIIKAAFVVWGRNFYSKMNLTEVAEYLGVTKPALYRHFSSKDALLDALYVDFFDRFAEFVAQVLPVRASPPTMHDRILTMANIMAQYFINKKYDFLFFLNLVMGQEKPGRIFMQELERRGLVLNSFDACQGGTESLSLLRIVSVTVVFSVALFHIEYKDQVDEPSVAAAQDALRSITELVEQGLCSLRAVPAPPDMSQLDGALTQLLDSFHSASQEQENTSGHILSALARTIGELGPYEASMKMVAQKAGLAKSTLYSHFASKEEMLRQLFLNEFETLARILESALTLSADPLGKLYLTMRVVTDYLRSHRDILFVMDWVRLQRIPLGMLMPQRSLELFSFARDLPLRPSLADWDDLTLARWVIFLVVNQLMVELRHGVDEAESMNNLKKLYIYIVTGVQGWTA